MARLAAESDFVVKVESVGQFTFGRRTMRDEVAIQVEYAKLIDGATPTEWLQTVCGWLSTFKVLTVGSPEGWSPDELDPLDPQTYAKMSRVYNALVDKERSFRGGKSSDGSG